MDVITKKQAIEKLNESNSAHYDAIQENRKTIDAIKDKEEISLILLEELMKRMDSIKGVEGIEFVSDSVNTSMSGVEINGLRVNSNYVLFDPHYKIIQYWLRQHFGDRYYLNYKSFYIL